MLSTFTRVGVLILLALLWTLIMADSMWSDSRDTSTLTSSGFAFELLTDWTFAVVALGALLAMAMIGASYLVRDERLENLLWEREEDDVE